MSNFICYSYHDIAALVHTRSESKQVLVSRESIFFTCDRILSPIIHVGISASFHFLMSSLICSMISPLIEWGIAPPVSYEF